MKKFTMVFIICSVLWALAVSGQNTDTLIIHRDLVYRNSRTIPDGLFVAPFFSTYLYRFKNGLDIINTSADDLAELSGSFYAFNKGCAIGYYACMLYLPDHQTYIAWAVNGNYGKIDEFTST